MLPPAWEPAFAAARGAPLTVVVGPTDAGKTTLATALVNDLVGRGLSVAVVDTDLGQSEIGPPTTVGLAGVTRPLRRLGEAEVLALHFVGATSPSGDVLGVVVGARRLVDRARALGFPRVIVDTSGLVAGHLGRWLKRAKIDLLGPDLLVALQTAGELEGILRAYDGGLAPVLLRLPALPGVARRGPAARRRHRERAFAAHLVGAERVDLDLRRIVLRHPPLLAGPALGADEIAGAAAALGGPVAWGERQGREVVLVVEARPDATGVLDVGRRLGAHGLAVHVLPGLIGAIAGLDDVRRETLGIGVVERLDIPGRRLSVLTAVAPERIAGATIGRARLEAASPIAADQPLPAHGSRAADEGSRGGLPAPDHGPLPGC